MTPPRAMRNDSMTRAVVFAYHNVGVRCLKVLLAHGVDVGLVVTHRDSPTETIFFQSVAETARDYRIPVVTPEDANDDDTLARVRACQPQFLFSFYFRQMLKAPLLQAAERGAYNMHGSLLPRYRGRAPVNWAVLHGERETGATLHAMTVKPDDGGIIDQQAVPILPDDTAGEVFDKVTLAAETVLHRCLDGLVAGTAQPRAQDHTQRSYFGGRTPEDGRIDWQAGAARVHNLVRAVAPPYPGAFTTLGEGTLHVLKTLLETDDPGCGAPAQTGNGAASPAAGGVLAAAIFAAGSDLYARCADGGVLRILAAQYDGLPLDADGFRSRFGNSAAPGNTLNAPHP